MMWIFGLVILFVGLNGLVSDEVPTSDVITLDVNTSWQNGETYWNYTVRAGDSGEPVSQVCICLK
jgi:hypothetical protein